MEYRDDLKKLSWDALYQRLVNSEASLESYGADRKILVARIESLRSELRAAQDSLAKLEAKKEAEPLPTFEVGKCYRNRRGQIRGPLEKTSQSSGNVLTHPLSDGHLVYTVNGDRRKFDPFGSYDLLPGAVDTPPTWTPWPWLPDGEYRGYADFLSGCCISMNTTYAKQLRGHTSDPPVGRWQVKDGKATYLGEA